MIPVLCVAIVEQACRALAGLDRGANLRGANLRVRAVCAAAPAGLRADSAVVQEWLDEQTVAP